MFDNPKHMPETEVLKIFEMPSKHDWQFFETANATIFRGTPILRKYSEKNENLNIVASTGGAGKLLIN